MDKCTPDSHCWLQPRYNGAPCQCRKMLWKTSSTGLSTMPFMLKNIPIELDPNMPPGQIMMLNENQVEHIPPVTKLRKLRYRLRWWQIWRPRHIWLVVRPSALSFSYEAEVYDKRKPEHRKLMAELGKPGFAAISYKGVPFAPDADPPTKTVAEMIQAGVDMQARREATLTPAQSETIGDLVELYQPKTPSHYRRPASKSRRKKK